MAEISKNSRYRGSARFTPSDGERAAFLGIRSRAIHPAPGVLEHVIKEGERLDLLALHYYNDPRHWWRIVDANPEVVYGGDLIIRERVGTIILIPRSSG